MSETFGQVTIVCDGFRLILMGVNVSEQSHGGKGMMFFGWVPERNIVDDSTFAHISGRNYRGNGITFSQFSVETSY